MTRQRPAAVAQPTPAPSEEPTPQNDVAHPNPGKRLKLTRKKVLATSAVLLLVGIIIWNLAASNETPETTSRGPEYTTVLPNGKSVVTLGGWRRVSPPENDPVYAYVDTINGTGITVSQQPIPASFGRNIDGQVQKLAKSYNATEKITVDGSDVFIGTSSKGPQSVIFTRDDLLILVKSQNKIANSDWKQYINSLTVATLPNVPKY